MRLALQQPACMGKRKRAEDSSSPSASENTSSSCSSDSDDSQERRKRRKKERREKKGKRERKDAKHKKHSKRVKNKRSKAEAKDRADRKREKKAKRDKEGLEDATVPPAAVTKPAKQPTTLPAAAARKTWPQVPQACLHLNPIHRNTRRKVCVHVAHEK